MKRTLVIIGISITSLTYAQTKKTVTVKKPVAKATSTTDKNLPVIKSSTDSFSYAIGLQAASFYKTQLGGEVNTALVKKAFDDVYNNQPLALSQEVCNNTVQKKQM